jgi:radical SAM superfamily enzyme YgiQ (UPF0313 family)
VRVLLVNPPRSPHNALREHAPEHARPFIHKKLIGPPLGLLTIAGALTNHDVTVLELKGVYDHNPRAAAPEDLVADAVREHDPDIIGVTVIASEFPASMRILSAARSVSTRVLTVAGGLHATLCPRDFSRREVDVVCPGQSVGRFLQLVAALHGHTPLERIAGIYVNGPDGLRWTGQPVAAPDPAGSDFVMPARSFVKPWIDTYHVGGSPHPVTYLFTSLGCPFRCSFCSIWPQFGGRYHQREVESVIAELKSIDDYPIVRFADANTIVNTHWIDTLFDRIAQEGIAKEYVMDMRADTAAQHPRLIGKLARAGLKVVICGFESFRNEELRRYNKSADARRIQEAIAVFHANGISVRGNYVVPPDYTRDDFAALAEYAASNRVAFAGYTVLTPMPGTPLFLDRIHDIIDFDLARYNFFNCVLRTTLPLEQFYEQMARLWPIKMWREVI